jgi:hypothetical protein
MAARGGARSVSIHAPAKSATPAKNAGGTPPPAPNTQYQQTQEKKMKKKNRPEFSFKILNSFYVREILFQNSEF